MGDVVSLAAVRAAREPEVRPAGRMLTAIRYTPGCVERVGRSDPHVVINLPRRAGMLPEGIAMPAQDALELATALIAAVKGGPDHVA